MISVILTSQKFTRIPTEIRSCSTVLLYFKLNNLCNKKIFEDLIFEDKENYDMIIDNVFTNPSEQNFLIYRMDVNCFYNDCP